MADKASTEIALQPTNCCPTGRYYGVDERIELWGLQIPHNSARPQLEEVDPADAEKAASAASASAAKAPADVITWTSVDRLNMSIGLLYALSNLAVDQGIRCEGG